MFCSISKNILVDIKILLLVVKKFLKFFIK